MKCPTHGTAMRRSRAAGNPYGVYRDNDNVKRPRNYVYYCRNCDGLWEYDGFTHLVSRSFVGPVRG